MERLMTQGKYSTEVADSMYLMKPNKFGDYEGAFKWIQWYVSH